MNTRNWNILSCSKTDSPFSMFYKDRAEVPWDIQKCGSPRPFFFFGQVLMLNRYYHQRHDIFSRYDEGVWMTEDSWFGVTPEPVAKYAPKSKQTKDLINQLQAR